MRFLVRNMACILFSLSWKITTGERDIFLIDRCEDIKYLETGHDHPSMFKVFLTYHGAAVEASLIFVDLVILPVTGHSPFSGSSKHGKILGIQNKFL